MQINFSNKYNLNYSPVFSANLKSPKLKFSNEDFFIDIKGYGKNISWAGKVIDIADKAAKFITKNNNFEKVLKLITNGIYEANSILPNVDKKNHTGILRTYKKGWRNKSDWTGRTLVTIYRGSKFKRYGTYSDRLDKIAQSPLYNPYSDISLTVPVFNYLEHGNYKSINNALSHVEEIYNNLFDNYILKEPKKKNLKDINSKIAEIRWIMAHATPWERGSDAISNTYIRAIYKAMGIKTSPLKSGISLDLEAFCTELKDYKKNFHKYFVEKPYIVD